MKNKNVIKNVINSDATRTTRMLALVVTGVVTLFIFSLAVTASAATLTRQLEVGSRGQDVSDLQTFLAKDTTIYPQGLVTGYFGSLTKAAVSNFQSRNGIASVGRVGPVTLAAINIQMSGSVSGADIYAPTISSLGLSVTSASATLSWNTNENSSAIIYHDTSPISMTEGNSMSGVTIGGSSTLVHTDLRTSHLATLTSLSPNTTYYYVVYVRDGSGNESITWPSTFRTTN